MDKKLKAKWVDALRSGEYAQTRAALKDDTGYCCLGVLCEVMGFRLEGNSFVDADGRKLNGFGAVWVEGGPRDVFRSLLPGGLHLLSYATRRGLAASNDQGRSFDEIADVIEKDL